MRVVIPHHSCNPVEPCHGAVIHVGALNIPRTLCNQDYSNTDWHIYDKQSVYEMWNCEHLFNHRICTCCQQRLREVEA